MSGYFACSAGAITESSWTENSVAVPAGSGMLSVLVPPPASCARMPARSARYAVYEVGRTETLAESLGL